VAQHQSCFSSGIGRHKRAGACNGSCHCFKEAAIPAIGDAEALIMATDGFEAGQRPNGLETYWR